LESAFVTLTAGKGFRMTGTTNSNGQYKFNSLNKGKFYVQALLKEYEFDRNTVTIELEDGDH